MISYVQLNRAIVGSLAVAPFLLSGCASSDVATFKAATTNDVRNIRVTEVKVTLETPKPNPLLRATLMEELEKALPGCASGLVDHRMDVAVVNFEDQNVAQAVLIGDDIELAARVKFTNLTSNEVTGEYYLENSFFWGGFLGAAMMSNAERSLSRDFTESLCDEVFGVKLKADSATLHEDNPSVAPTNAEEDDLNCNDPDLGQPAAGFSRSWKVLRSCN